MAPGASGTGNLLVDLADRAVDQSERVVAFAEADEVLDVVHHDQARAGGRAAAIGSLLEALHGR